MRHDRNIEVEVLNYLARTEQPRVRALLQTADQLAGARDVRIFRALSGRFTGIVEELVGQAVAVLDASEPIRLRGWVQSIAHALHTVPLSPLREQFLAGQLDVDAPIEVAVTFHQAAVEDSCPQADTMPPLTALEQVLDEATRQHQLAIARLAEARQARTSVEQGYRYAVECERLAHERVKRVRDRMRTRSRPDM